MEDWDSVAYPKDQIYCPRCKYNTCSRRDPSPRVFQKENKYMKGDIMMCPCSECERACQTLIFSRPIKITSKL
jgi:hypothetical protein